MKFTDCKQDMYQNTHVNPLGASEAHLEKLEENIS